MALPKFSELSTTIQVLVILAVGALLWAGSEFVYLRPMADSNEKKRADAGKLAKDLEPLRPYEQKRGQLITDNQRLELKLATLRQIVPDEKEVDNFIRLVESASNSSGIDVRRFTAKPVLTQDYYVEVPFEMEIDGPYYEVLNFFDRLGKLERIVNVSDLKMTAIHGGKALGKSYAYSPNETVISVCTITTFFSREGEAPQPAKPGKPGQPAAAKPPQKK